MAVNRRRSGFSLQWRRMCCGLWFATLPAMGLAANPKEDLSELRGRIEKLQKELASAEESRSEAADALRLSEKAISETNRRLYELEQQRRDLENTLTVLADQAIQMQTQIRGRQDRLGRLLNRQYTSGERDTIKLLLNNQDPQQMARQMHYYGYVSRAQAEMIQKLRSSLAELDDIRRRSAMKKDELARVLDSEQVQKRKLEDEHSGRRQVLSKISSQIERQRKEMTTLQRDEKRLTNLVENLAKLLAKKPKKPKPVPVPTPAPTPTPTPAPVGTPAPSPPPVAPPDDDDDEKAEAFVASFSKGKLHWPVRGAVVHKFGSPREDTGITWKGIFIRAAQGADVRAVAAGRVVFADWLRGFGNLMILDHGNGYMSLYGSNESLLRKVGQVVKAGEAVAAAGNSGGNPESGLYFELRHQSKPFDPIKWLR